MKNIFLKILYSSLLICLLFVGLSLFSDRLAIRFVKNACATQWGACNPDPNYQVCPNPNNHVAIADCISSVDFKVVINSVGSAPIPPGTPFRIQIYPSDGSGNSCQYVTCLTRTTDYLTPGWGTAGTPYQVTLDQIGCDLTGHCTNNFTVKINFAASTTGISCPEYNQNFDVQNGNPVPVNYNVNCTSTVPPPTCTTIPDQQQCQQRPTGCVEGWHTNPDTTKTCDQTGGLNTCCIKDVCTKPTQPTNVRVTCSGCQ